MLCQTLVGLATLCLTAAAWSTPVMLSRKFDGVGEGRRRKNSRIVIAHGQSGPTELAAPTRRECLSVTVAAGVVLALQGAGPAAAVGAMGVGVMLD